MALNIIPACVKLIYSCCRELDKISNFLVPTAIEKINFKDALSVETFEEQAHIIQSKRHVSFWNKKTVKLFISFFKKNIIGCKLSG